jgi:predicted nucleic-acid-binding protein
MGIKDIEHIDTNIVVRLITGDNPKQYKKAKKLVCKKNKTFIFEDSAMMEVVYVLSGKIYNYPRNKIAEGIKLISRFESIYYNKGLIEDSLNLYVANPSLSYVDCYLTAVTNLSGEKPLWTFDHKLALKCPVAKEL